MIIFAATLVGALMPSSMPQPGVMAGSVRVSGPTE
jgi:hypothetical protein